MGLLARNVALGERATLAAYFSSAAFLACGLILAILQVHFCYTTVRIVCKCMCINICTPVCMCVCVYIHITYACGCVFQSRFGVC